MLPTIEPQDMEALEHRLDHGAQLKVIPRTPEALRQNPTKNLMQTPRLLKILHKMIQMKMLM